MSSKCNFMIIDDSPIDIFIAVKMVQNAVPGANVLSFLNAVEALEMINNSCQSEVPTVMFVDINMPVMDGFQFMEAFEKLPFEKQNAYIPYFLTSSTNESDIAASDTFKTIRKFLNKPLTKNNIEDILSTVI